MAAEDYSDLIAAAKGEDYSDIIAAAQEPEEGGPESFLDPKKFKPSPSHRKFNNTGPIAEVEKSLPRIPLEQKVNEGAEAAATPLLSAADRASGGGLAAALRFDRDVLSKNPIARFVDEHLPAIGKQGGAVAERALGDVESYRQEHPVASGYTDLPGYLEGAPRAIGMGVERALPQVTNRAAQVARSILGGGAASAGVAGLEAAQQGKPMADIAREAGRGFVGGTAVSAPMSVGAAALGAGARAVLGSKGAKAREYLETRGQPLTAHDTSDSAIGAAAQRADEAVKGRLAGYKGDVASKPYLEEVNKITPEQANELVNIDSIYNNISAAARDPANLQSAGKLNDLLKMLDHRRMTAADGSEPVLMTQEQLNGLRRALGSISGVGESTAPQKSALRQAFADTKALVDQGPYAEANRRFSGGMDDLNESLGMVGLRSSFDPDEPIKGNLRVAAQRQGQNTVTAGGDTERLDIDAFKAKHPDLANAIDAPEILRRQGDLGFHLGAHGHGGLIDRLAGSLPLPAMVAAYAMGHGLKGLGAAAAMAAYENRNALAGRVLYNPAQNAQIAAQMMLMGVPVASTPGREVVQEAR